MDQIRVIVVGSALLDYCVRIPTLPEWGATIGATKAGIYPGGKALNQAVAASRLGADVGIIAAVGKDAAGKQVEEALDAEGVSVDHLVGLVGASTRRNVALVDHEAQVGFVQWAHEHPAVLSIEMIRKAEKAIAEADVVLLTLEASPEVLQAVIGVVRANGGHGPAIVVNPAPAERAPVRLPWSFYRDALCVVPNLIEAASMTQRMPPSIEVANDREAALAYARSAARQLHAHGVRTACITAGPWGCVTLESGETSDHTGFADSRPIDATGASDAFCASLAISLVRDRLPLSHAVRRANAAGAHAVTVFGGAPSMPRQADIDRVLRSGARHDSIDTVGRPRTRIAVGRETLVAGTAFIVFLTAVIGLLARLV